MVQMGFLEDNRSVKYKFRILADIQVLATILRRVLRKQLFQKKWGPFALGCVKRHENPPHP